jgi:hypothetical protein
MAPGGWVMKQGRKYFFFEKKKQKTFICWLARPERSVRIPKSKSFLVLFFKKVLLFPFLLRWSASCNA